MLAEFSTRITTSHCYHWLLPSTSLYIFRKKKKPSSFIFLTIRSYQSNRILWRGRGVFCVASFTFLFYICHFPFLFTFFCFASVVYSDDETNLLVFSLLSFFFFFFFSWGGILPRFLDRMRGATVARPECGAPVGDRKKYHTIYIYLPRHALHRL